MTLSLTFVSDGFDVLLEINGEPQINFYETGTVFTGASGECALVRRWRGRPCSRHALMTGLMLSSAAMWHPLRSHMHRRR